MNGIWIVAIFAVALASNAGQQANIPTDEAAKAVLCATETVRFQPSMTWKPNDPITVEPGKGWMIMVGNHKKSSEPESERNEK